MEIWFFYILLDAQKWNKKCIIWGNGGIGFLWKNIGNMSRYIHTDILFISANTIFNIYIFNKNSDKICYSYFCYILQMTGLGYWKYYITNDIIYKVHDKRISSILSENGNLTQNPTLFRQSRREIF